MEKRKPRGAGASRGHAARHSGREAKGRIVLKLALSVDASGPEPLAYPDLLLLADEQGWEFLSRLCRRRARRARAMTSESPDFCESDAEDHEHLSLYVDQELSDRVDVRLGTMTPENTGAVFARWGISAATSVKESLTTWCDVLKTMAHEAEAGLRPSSGESIGERS